jgi:hypothetical protein
VWIGSLHRPLGTAVEATDWRYNDARLDLADCNRVKQGKGMNPIVRGAPQFAGTLRLATPVLTLAQGSNDNARFST